MAKYRVYLETTASLAVEVEADNVEDKSGVYPAAELVEEE